MTHTPGPWIWDEPSNWHGLEARVYVAEPYGVVAHVPIEAWRPRATGHANANLIAAAPELLEALKACHLQMLQSNNSSEYAEKANEMAIAAIAKAEGRRDKAIAVGMTPATSLVCNPDLWFDDAEAEANAYLMAAAPELYEALARLLSAIPTDALYEDEMQPHLERARAAIRKVEGAA